MRTAPRRWGLAWLAVTASLALHVWDEAANDFLAVYNPTVQAVRNRWPIIPLPAFTFEVWLGGLIAAVIVLALFAPAAFRGRPWLRFLAWPYGVLMLLNGVQHIAVSLYRGEMMPGAISSPLLIIASIGLLIETRRALDGSVTSAGPIGE